MARDKWGYGPTDFLANIRGIKPKYVCSLTLPIGAYTLYRRKLKRLARRTYEHLPQPDGTQKIRLYCHSVSLDGFLVDLFHECIPYDFIDEQGFSQRFRCFPDGHYGPVNERYLAEHESTLKWEDQWKLHQHLKILQLINPPKSG